MTKTMTTVILKFPLYRGGLLMLQFSKDPVEVDGEWNKFLGKLDYGFTCIFAIEVLLKVSVVKSWNIIKSIKLLLKDDVS